MSARKPLDLDAIREDIEAAERSPEMAKHVALDHGPELLEELDDLRAELAQAQVTEQNVYWEGCRHVEAVTQQRDEALAAIGRVRALCGNTGEYQARAKYLHCGSARLLAVEILAALDGGERDE